jgi:predicted metal-dependent phosphoesterase TrpH
MARYECDLHTHSVRSDGNDTVLELIDHAAQAWLKVLALTDHDVRPPVTVEVDGDLVDVKAYAKQKGVSFIGGIEYSCDTDVDDVHIVGLGCDFTQPDFLAVEQAMAKSKVDAYRKLTEVLTQNGILVDWKDVLRNADGSSRAEDAVQRKHIFETIASKGYTKTWQEAKLLVRDNPDYNIRREKIDPLEAIAIIRKSGGVAILAHPHLIDAQIEKNGRVIDRETYIERLIEGGLMGIEAAYPYDKTSYKGTQTSEEIRQSILRAYGERLPVISGGSDYHADGKKGVTNPRELGEGGVTYDYFRANPLLSALIK